MEYHLHNTVFCKGSERVNPKYYLGRMHTAWPCHSDRRSLLGTHSHWDDWSQSQHHWGSSTSLDSSRWGRTGQQSYRTCLLYTADRH